jgi:hypothetical protein
MSMMMNLRDKKARKMRKTTFKAIDRLGSLMVQLFQEQS